MAARGDYLHATHVQGGVQISTAAAEPHAFVPRPEDVEQGLCDLRRAHARAPEGPAKQATATLARAARL
jgi:hypothetical protein